MLATLFSKETPVEARALYQHHVTGSCEFGIMKGTSQIIAENFLNALMFDGLTKGQICAEKFSLSHKREFFLPWLPFTLEPFKCLIRVCLGWFVFALMVLIVREILHFQRMLEQIYPLSINKGKAFRKGVLTYLKRNQVDIIN